MAVKMRLMRLGKKKQPVYRVVVADGRKPRQGRYIEAIGRYDARQEPSLIEIDNDKAVDWLSKGAQPTDPVRKLLEISGAWSAYKVSRGEIYTVAPKTAPVADVEEKVVDEAAEAVTETAEAAEEQVDAAAEEVVAEADEVVAEAEAATEEVVADATEAAEEVTEAAEEVTAEVTEAAEEVTEEVTEAAGETAEAADGEETA